MSFLGKLFRSRVHFPTLPSTLVGDSPESGSLLTGLPHGAWNKDDGREQTLQLVTSTQWTGRAGEKLTFVQLRGCPACFLLCYTLVLLSLYKKVFNT